MSRFSKITGIFMILLFTAVFAYAAWDSDDVNAIVKKIKAGEGFYENGSISDSQIIEFCGTGVCYMIDVKAKLCFAKTYGAGADGIILVPCKAIKDGYPVFAPVITWEK